MWRKMAVQSFTRSFCKEGEIHIHHHSAWLNPSRRSDQRPEKRPQMSCPPLQWLAEPTPTERTEAKAAPSPVVTANIEVGCAHADRANRGQSSALTWRPRHPSGWLGPRRPSVQRPEQRPHLSSPQPQWLAGLTPTKRTEARAAPSSVVPASKVAGWAHADQANRGQTSALTCRARLHSGWKGPRRPSAQRPL
jgi:hypothetical protein